MQVVERWKNRIGKRVLELTTERDERMMMLVNSYIGKKGIKESTEVEI